MGVNPPEKTDHARVRQSAERLDHSAAVQAHSAERVEQSADVQEDSADRRTELSADRTVLAAERTYAAWVRTGFGALAGGVGAKALFAKILPVWFGGLTGSLLILFSIFCFMAAVWRELTPGIRPKHGMHRLPKPLLLTVNGSLVIVDIAALVGIWWVRV